MVVALVAAGASFGCGGSDERSDFGGSSGGASSSGGSSSGGFGSGGDAGASSGGSSQDGCSEAAKLVYVVSGQNDLYSFDPSTLTFKKIGPLSCPTSETPNSMAVDRSGTAWVNMSEGSLMKVSTADASCTATAFQKGQQGFVKFGMAFAADSAGSTAETLYVAGITGFNEGSGLAKIDLSTFQLTKIGDYSAPLNGKGAELTGTGDGKLYGFFTTVPATLAQIDKATGATSGNKTLDGVVTGTAWAFSFWGGDFWFYTSVGQPSTVTRYAASGDGSIKNVKNDVGGFRIVGAGVSTCAPTAPPR